MIFADESFAWKVAGLRQLDRLALALNDYVTRSDWPGLLPVFVQWADNCLPSQRRLPPSHRLPKLAVGDNLETFASEIDKSDQSVLCFSTHLVVARGGFAQFLDDLETKTAPILLLTGVETAAALRARQDWDATLSCREDLFPNPNIARKWSYLRDPASIHLAEKALLLSTAKPQDGIIARYVNRPVSRVVTRWLVRLPITPNQWTLAVLAAPITGSLLLMRGDYLGAAIAAILFQVQSMLDGCDGELARAKYLETPLGSQLDGICDRLATMLLAIGIGVGLSRQPGLTNSLSWFYLLEGLFTALLIGVSETLLQRTTIEESLQQEKAANPYPTYVRGNQEIFNPGDQLKVWAIKKSGMLFLGTHLTSLFVQLTKRDVFNLCFAIFILCRRSQWVLHILAFIACGITLMALKSLLELVFASERRAAAVSED